MRHLSLDLTADFERRVLHGVATLTIEARADAAEIVLDIDGLGIQSVRTNLGATTWTIGERDSSRGSPMTIPLTPGVRLITIDYETSPDAGALQWLAPPQTASGKPFLFSQGESIFTRTWIPTQDSPGIRQTYDARIIAPEDLRVVMSATQHRRDGRAFHFAMERPIPPYLIAIGIGDLHFRSVGPRTGVYAEPSVLDAAAYEFGDTEHMLQAAEALYGRYRWGRRYDMLVLPPSFPFGGMENPTLTFLTPTAIAGDRSLVSLVAHELAHSWSGNLVTNAVWADFWLNEGVTSYIESRIVEQLYGLEFANMSRSLDWAGIQRALAGDPEATRLHLRGERDAEDYVSAIAYDKGALFLRTIERIIGRRRMDAYLRTYFDSNAFKPMTTDRFLAFFREQVVRGDQQLEQELQLDAWAYDTGLPSNAEAPRSERFERVDAQVAAFNAGGAAQALPWTSWGTFERQRFLQGLPRQVEGERLDELERTLSLNETGNMEVLFDWLTVAVRNGYDPAVSALESFLARQGRGKFIRPLFRALMEQGDWGRAHARRIYAHTRPSYHPIVVSAVDRIVTPAN